MNCQPTFRHTGLFPARLLNLAETLFPEISAATSAQTNKKTWAPAVDVTENPASYIFTAELANVPAEDVKVAFQDGVLTIKGERKPAARPDGVVAHFSEIAHGAFQRGFTLPKDADGDAVEATVKNGLLTVTVGKKADRQPKEVTVKAA